MKMQDVAIYKHTQSDSLIVSCSSPNKTEKDQKRAEHLFDRGPAIHIPLMWHSCIDIPIYIYMRIYVPMHLFIYA